jgi:hypothetical protein
MNWPGKPLVSLAAIVSLIESTKTATGLRVRSEIDQGSYPQGTVLTKQLITQINLKRHAFHGDWNYTIDPRVRSTVPVIS